MKNLLFTSKRASIIIVAIAALIFIVETYYPMGDMVKENFGIIGVMIGKAVAIYSLYVSIRLAYLVVGDMKVSE